MNKEIIKECFRLKQYRVYSLIVSDYFDKIEELKPKVFSIWLAKEIDIPIETINLSSLNSALVRERKKKNKKNKLKGVGNSNPASESDQKQDEQFAFSKPDNSPKKSRIEES